MRLSLQHRQSHKNINSDRTSYSCATACVAKTAKRTVMNAYFMCVSCLQKVDWAFSFRPTSPYDIIDHKRPRFVAIVTLGTKRARLALLSARFITENGQKRRRLMGINIDGVKRARRHGIDLGRKEDVLSLLSITFSGMSVDITFSGDAMLSLETDQIRIFAADLDEGWVTGFQPSHDSD